MNMILRRQHDGGNSDELHDLFCQNSFCVGVGFSRAFGRNEKNPRSFVYNFRSTELLVKTNFASALDFSGCLISMHVKCSSALDFVRVFQTIQPFAANIILQAFLSNLGRVLGILILKTKRPRVGGASPGRSFLEKV